METSVNIAQLALADIRIGWREGEREDGGERVVVRLKD